MDDDLIFMAQAMELAAEAAAAEEIPVGALVVYHPAGVVPRVIGRGYNLRERDADPTAHAEVVAMRQAGKALGYWRLVDCSLYVTLEPCPMCAGALVNARLERLIYGCRDPKAGGVESIFRLCDDSRLNHRLQILGGVMGLESAELLRAFFRARRGR